jgi:hypothetical protein
MEIIKSKKQNDEAKIPDRFEVPRQNAQYIIETSVGMQSPNIVLKAQQIHGRCYMKYRYVEENALTDDGRLVSELDGSHDDEYGRVTVNYLLARGIDKTIDEAGASVRLIDITEKGSIHDLPTYKYFKDSFQSNVKTRLQSIIDQYGNKGVREIAALSVVDSTNNAGSYELLRAIMQNSLMRDESYGYREVYLASLTKISLRPILRFAGCKAVDILGEPVRIYNDDPRQRIVYVTPVIIDPNKALDGIIDDIESSVKESDIDNLVQKLHFLTDGLSPNQISSRVALFLDKNGN